MGSSFINYKSWKPHTKKFFQHVKYRYLKIINKDDENIPG